MSEYTLLGNCVIFDVQVGYNAGLGPRPVPCPCLENIRFLWQLKASFNITSQVACISYTFAKQTLQAYCAVLPNVSCCACGLLREHIDMLVEHICCNCLQNTYKQCPLAKEVT